MKTINFIIFFSAFFAVYSLVNVYIFIKIGKIVPHNTASKAIYIISCVLVSFSFLAGRLLEKVTICTVSDIFIWIGSFWMAFMVYLLIFFLFSDIIFMSDRLIHWLPHGINYNRYRTNVISTLIIMIAAAVIVFAGYLNSINPIVRKLDVFVDKNAGTVKELNVAMVSDIHLGIIISNSRLRTLVQSINDLEPDVVLLAGDIVDEDIAPVIKQNLGETLRNIKARYGTFAVTGNHEFIGGGGSVVCFSLVTDPVYVVRPGIRNYNDSYAVPEVETWEHIPGESVEDLIYRIGGVTGNVDLARSTIQSNSTSVPVWNRGAGFSDALISSGDTLRLVVQGNDIYVAGAVHQRGIIAYIPGAPVSAYIERAGGSLYNGSTGGTTLTRDGVPIASGKEALEREVLPGDVIEVPYSWIARHSQEIGILATVVGITSTIIYLTR